jgi:hypothetical protein
MTGRGKSAEHDVITSLTSGVRGALACATRQAQPGACAKRSGVRGRFRRRDAFQGTAVRSRVGLRLMVVGGSE